MAHQEEEEEEVFHQSEGKNNRKHYLFSHRLVTITSQLTKQRPISFQMEHQFK